MNDIIRILNKWTIKGLTLPSDVNIQVIVEVVANIIIFEYKQRLARIEGINAITDMYTLVTSVVCFGLLWITSIILIGYVNNLDQLFYISLLYGIIDHFVDSTINESDKVDLINLMKERVYNPIITDTDPNIIKIICQCYNAILVNQPNIKNHLIEAFISEIISAKIQTSSFKQSFNHMNVYKLGSTVRQYNSVYDLYLQITRWKGGATVLAMIDMIMITNNIEDEYDLGCCIQLCDDIADMFDDINLDINTAVTENYSKHGNIDHIVRHTILLIDQLNGKYNAIKPVLIIGVIYGTLSNGAISQSLQSIFNSYAPQLDIDKDTAVAIIYNFIRRKL